MGRSPKVSFFWALALAAFYIVLGVMGSQFYYIYIVAGILGIPLSLWTAKYGIRSANMIIFLGATVTVGIWVGVIPSMVLLTVIIPSIVCGYLYQQKKPLSTIILTVGLSYFLSILIFVGIMNLVYNINIFVGYLNALTQLEKHMLQYLSQQETYMLGQLPQLRSIWGSVFKLTEEQLVQSYGIQRIVVSQLIYMMQHNYPALLLISMTMVALFQVMLQKLLMYVLEWESPPVKELAIFSISPGVPFLFVLSIIINNTVDVNRYSTISIGIDNMQMIFLGLMFIVGILFTVHMIKTSRSGIGFKIVMTVLSIFWLLMMPIMYVFIGFIEGIFNFRRIKRFP